MSEVSTVGAMVTIGPISAGRPLFDPAGNGAGGIEQWLHLLRRHSPRDAMRQVKGRFAVALTLDDGSIFMAVDRFGSLPLYYTVRDSALVCGLRAGEVAGGQASIDGQALYDYLYLHAVPSPRTAYEGVHRLPPAHYAIFREGRLELIPYWTPRFQPLAQAQASFGALREEFNALLRQAVQRQLPEGRAACFLSGGTDSSTVAGLITALSGQPAAAYSIGFEAEGYDEMAYARLAARHFGCEHHEYYVTPDDLVRDIPRVAAAFDQPFGNSSVLPAYHCALQAQGDGHSIMLAGDGGDEFFGGNTRYAKQESLSAYQDRLPAWLRRGLLDPALGHPLSARVPLLRKGHSYIKKANMGLPDRLQDYNLLQMLGTDAVLTPAFRARVDQVSVRDQQRRIWGEAHAEHELNRHLAFDWRYTLTESDLPKVVGATKLAGVTVRFPFLDDDLVDFSMRLPTEYKLKGKQLRWFFKEALRGFLPDEILTKKKQGFGLPFGVWTMKHAGLQALARDAVQSVAARGIVQQPFAQALMRDHLPAHPHYYGTMVWILIMLEYWLRQHAPNHVVRD